MAQLIATIFEISAQTAITSFLQRQKADITQTVKSRTVWLLGQLLRSEDMNPCR